MQTGRQQGPPRWPSGEACASRVADLGSSPAFPVDLFSRSSYTSDLNIDAPLATPPGSWRSRVRPGTSWSGVSIL